MNAECKCSLRVRLVGDGCPTCNPEYWKQFRPHEYLPGAPYNAYCNLCGEPKLDPIHQSLEDSR